ncbi:MAG: TolC family outer membrane protein [Rhodospirillales bacterium]
MMPAVLYSSKRTAITIRTAFGVLAIGLTLAASPPATAETLEETLIAAYLTNPDLAAQRSNLRATDEGVSQAISNWRPTVEMNSSIGREYNNSSTRTGSARSQSREPKSLGFDVSQPLFRGGRTLAETSQAENSVLAERARLTAQEQDILLAAATAYLDVFRDQAVLQLNTNNEDVLARQLEAAQDRFQVGEITRTDVHQAEARLARATADRIQSEANLEASRASYRTVTGISPTTAFDLPASPPGSPPSKDAAVQEAALNNPLVIAAQYDERSAIDNIDLVWGELLPELELSLSANRDLNSSSEDDKIDSAEALLSLTMPLYQSGAVHSRVREAKQDAARFRQIVDQQRRTVTEQATRAWENLQAAEARVTSFQTQIQAATVALDGVQREAAVGSRTVLDVLDAEQELLNARVSYITAQRDAGVAMFELLSSVGRMTAHHLQLPVDLYDPDSHYREIRDKWYGLSASGGDN